MNQVNIAKTKIAQWRSMLEKPFAENMGQSDDG